MKAVLCLGTFMVVSAAFQGAFWPEIRVEPVDRITMTILFGTLIVSLALLKMDDSQ